jgi:hypothetical protein
MLLVRARIPLRSELIERGDADEDAMPDLYEGDLPIVLIAPQNP